jgi:hypothetical protein
MKGPAALMFEEVRQFFQKMQAEGYLIEIRSFDMVTGTRGADAVGFTIRGMCTRQDEIETPEKQPLMIEDDHGPRAIGRQTD